MIIKKKYKINRNLVKFKRILIQIRNYQIYLYNQNKKVKNYNRHKICKINHNYK